MAHVSNLEPITKLTNSIIDKLVIHASMETLNIAKATSAITKITRETNTVPQLYYLKKTFDNTLADWSIHALCSDVSKFLLKDYIRLSEIAKPEFIPQTSDLEIDTKDLSGIKLTYDGGLIVIDGKIPLRTIPNSGTQSHYVELIVTPKKGMIRNFPDVAGELSYESIEDLETRTQQFTREDFRGPDNQLRLILEFTEPGQEIPIKINWDVEFRECITVALTNESTLS